MTGIAGRQCTRNSPGWRYRLKVTVDGGAGAEGRIGYLAGGKCLEAVFHIFTGRRRGVDVRLEADLAIAVTAGKPAIIVTRRTA